MTDTSAREPGALSVGVDSADVPTPQNALRRNALGLVAAATLSIVFISPALAFYGNWGPVTTIAGGASAFVFVIGALLMLPTALSYALVARHLPSAGSAYSWVGSVLNRHVGKWLGWMILPYYLLATATAGILFGLFFTALLSQLGLHVGPTNFGTYLIGVVLIYSVAAAFGFRGVATSSRVATAVVIFEVAVVLALAITILLDNTSHLSARPFDPSAGHITSSTFWLAMPIAFFSFLGFDVTSTAAEETRLARSAIPRAMLLALGLFTLYLLFTSYAFGFAVPLSQVSQLVSSGITPVTPIAQKYWGGADAIVSLTGMTAGTGATIAGVVGTSRILFAMARDGALPSAIGRVTGRSQIPAVAMCIVLALVIGYVVIAGEIYGPLNAFVVAGTSVVFFALVLYLFVNVVNFLLHYRHRDRVGFGIAANAVVPAAGVVAVAAILYKSFFQSLWDAGWVTVGRGIVVFALAWALVGAIYAVIGRRGDYALEFDVATALDQNRE